MKFKWLDMNINSHDHVCILNRKKFCNTLKVPSAIKCLPS